jgi:signal transduction histidine kinase
LSWYLSSQIFLKGVQESTTLCLQTVIEESLEIASVQASNKALEMVLDMGPLDLPYCVIGDGVRIRQILLNLLNNAVKFSDKRFSPIIVKASTTSSEPDGTCEILISVQDFGIGMEKDTLQNIFKPFVQADSSVSRKYGGSLPSNNINIAKEAD